MTVSHSQSHSQNFFVTGQIFLSLVKVTVTSHSHWSKSQSLVKVTKISQSLWLVVKLCKTNTRWCDLVNDECSRDSFSWGWRISLGEVISSNGSTWRSVLVEKSGPEGSLTFRHPKISKSRTTMNFKISSGEIEEIYSVSLYPERFLLVFFYWFSLVREKTAREGSSCFRHPKLWSRERRRTLLPQIILALDTTRGVYISEGLRVLLMV